MLATTPNQMIEERLGELCASLRPPIENAAAVSSAVAGLRSSVAELANCAKLAGWPGLPELLRLLASGLAQRGHLSVNFSDSENHRLSLWFALTQRYCRGELPANETYRLVVELQKLTWVPELPVRMREFLVERLTRGCDKHVEQGTIQRYTPPDPVLPDQTASAMGAVDADLSVVGAEEPIISNAGLVAAIRRGEEFSGECRDKISPDHSPTGWQFTNLVDSSSSVSDQDNFEMAAFYGKFADSDCGENLFADPAEPRIAVFPLRESSAPDLPNDEAVTESKIGKADRCEDALVEGPQLDAAFVEGHRDDVVHTPEAIADAPIWISPEELDLAAQAVSIQLMPLAESLFAVDEAIDRAALVEDLAYQTGLICSALEMLGLRELHRSSDIVLLELATLSTRSSEAFQEQLGLLMRWQVALLGFLQQPSDLTSQIFVIETLSESTWTLPLDVDASTILAMELARVIVGRDPTLRSVRREYAGMEDVSLSVASDVLPSVLDGMLSELPGNARQLARRLHAIARDGSGEDIDVARRIAHTLKGDANTVGVRGIASLTHSLEDILVELAKSPRKPEHSLGLTLEDAADCVEAMADHVLGRGPVPDDSLDVLQRVMSAANNLFDGSMPTAVKLESDADAPRTPKHVTFAEPAQIEAEPAQGQATHRVETPTATLQIPVALLDELLRLSSETIVVARQVEEQLRGIGLIRSELQQQGSAARELVTQLDDLVDLRGAALQSARLEHGREVDALELDQYNELHVVSRRLIETSGDTGAHLQSLERSLGLVSDLSAQQDRIHQELQLAVVGTRSVPVEHQVPRFQRVVRQTGRMLLKEAELIVTGAATLVDSDILEGMAEPLVHALRNAVDHGIETPDERLASGKSTVGKIRLDVERRGGDIVFRLSDDGRGLDYSAIRARAIARGLLQKDDPSSEFELNRLILLPGFSTRDEATQVSGRGIGMDVVYRRVNELRGAMSLRSQSGLGTVLEVVLPASLVSAHVALAHSSAGTVALITNGILQFLPIGSDAIDRSEEGWWFDLDGERIPAVPLDTLMDANSSRRERDALSVGVLVQDEAGTRHLVLVSSIDEMRSVIVKGFGRYVAPVPGVRGATILGTGGVAPVVDLGKLLSDLGWRRRSPSVIAQTAPVFAQRVIVADDSLSVRRALSQLMQDAGFEAVTARDGLEALSLIGQQVPAAVLVDLEMPRMNGLEFTTYLRNHEATANVPVIMITSRTSERHQQLAQNAGVTHVMGKPYGDDELVALVRKHVVLQQAAMAQSKDA